MMAHEGAPRSTARNLTSRRSGVSTVSSIRRDRRGLDVEVGNFELDVGFCWDDFELGLELELEGGRRWSPVFRVKEFRGNRCGIGARIVGLADLTSLDPLEKAGEGAVVGRCW